MNVWLKIRGFCLFLTICVGIQQSGWAELPQTRLKAIFPCGGQTGTSFPVSLTDGANLEEVTELIFNHPGITAQKESPDQPRQFQVTIDSSVPPGNYEVACLGPQGLSNSRAFVVGVRPENHEVKAGTIPQNAATIPLGSACYGAMSTPRDVNWFRFSAQKEQRVVLECWTRSIDSPLNAVVTIYDTSGRRPLAMSRSFPNQDTILVYDIPEDGDYLIKIHDVTYRHGVDLNYRLDLHRDPYLEFAYPSVLSAGTTSPVTLYGYNLPDGVRTGERIQKGELESVTVNVTVPENWRSLPGDHPVTTPMMSTNAFGYRLQQGTSVSNALRIGVVETPVLREERTGDEPQLLTLPVTIAGRFEKENETDRYRFSGEKGDRITIDVIGERQGGVIDPVLILDRVLSSSEPAASGASDQLIRISVTDDSTPSLNPNFFETRSADPTVPLTLPETGTYQISLKDRYTQSRGGPDLTYQLTVRSSAPKVLVVAVPGAPQSGKTGGITLRRGDRFPIAMYAIRQDGYEGDVHIEASQLPAGVKCEGALIRAGTHYTTLMLTTTRDATPGRHPIEFSATHKIATETDERSLRDRLLLQTTVVRMGTIVREHQGQQPAICRFTSLQEMSIQEEIAPILLTAETTSYSTTEGGTVRIPLTIQRESPSIEKIWLHLQEAPAGLTLNQELATIPKESDAFEFQLLIGNKVPPGIYPVWIRGETKINHPVPVSMTDGKPQDKKQNPLSVAIASPTFFIEVLPPQNP
ncbi:MAG TPA: hypothetical protein VNQ76_20750 [Planctomicrobium sp.]|nr:hypothetical protein [Planctomicrobium sp.]